MVSKHANVSSKLTFSTDPPNLLFILGATKTWEKNMLCTSLVSCIIFLNEMYKQSSHACEGKKMFLNCVKTLTINNFVWDISVVFWVYEGDEGSLVKNRYRTLKVFPMNFAYLVIKLLLPVSPETINKMSLMFWLKT